VTRSVFLDLLIVLGTLHSPLLTRHAGSLRHALRLITDNQDTTGNQASGKVIKATQALDKAGLSRGVVDVTGVVKAIKGDLIATDRLRALRSAS